jgi:dihydroflavonol-4-reductase
MKVFLTGATGFIGGNLARKLVGRGYKVRALVRRGCSLKFIEDINLELVEGDLLDEPSLERGMTGCKALFHTAALYTFWSPNSKVIYDTNVLGTKNVFLAAKNTNIEKIVYTSSESTLGIAENGIGDERMAGNVHKIPGDYKKSKFLAEQIVLKMCQDGVPAVIVNPTMPIGPYDTKPTPTGKVVLDYLNHKMFACVNTGLNVVDVEDVAMGHILALEKGIPGEKYLLGNKNITLRQIMDILEKITGVKAPSYNIPIWFALTIGYMDEFIEGKIIGRYPRIPIAEAKASRKYRHFDCSKAINQLGMPQTPIEESFKKSVDWFINNGYVATPKR